MPEFVYTIIFISAALWFSFGFYLNSTPPDTFANIAVFFGILFFALAFTFSIPAYFFSKRRHSEYLDKRTIYRKSLKWGFYASLGIVSTLILKAFDLINPINFGIFLVFYVSLFTQLKTRKH